MSNPSQSTQPNNSSNLYLFTFLATLLLLLFISTVIVLRSYVLRRHHRRRIEQALAAGVILAPDAQGSRKKHFGLRPKFHQVWTTPSQNSTWESIMPVSVRKLRRCINQPPTLDPPPSSFIHLWSLSLRLRSNNVHPKIQPPQPPPQRVETTKKLQVSVLVAMPSPRRPISSMTNRTEKCQGEPEDDELPDFVIGIAELPYISRTKKEVTIESII